LPELLLITRTIEPQKLYEEVDWGLLVFFVGLFLIVGVTELHGEAPVGLAILVVGWTSAIFWSTFLYRLLGIWCHRSRRTLAV